MYKHILVAVGIKPDMATLKSAVEIAREAGARVTALHVTRPASHFSTLTDRDFCAALQTFDKHEHTVIDRSKRVLDDAQCPGEAHIRMSPSHDASLGRVIADAARELGADLVIVGGNDPGWFRLHLQNVQKEVVRLCPSPVLVITPQCPPQARQAIGAIAARRIAD